MSYCGNLGEIKLYGILADSIAAGTRVFKPFSLEIMFSVNKGVWVELDSPLPHEDGRCKRAGVAERDQFRSQRHV